MTVSLNCTFRHPVTFMVIMLDLSIHLGNNRFFVTFSESHPLGEALNNPVRAVPTQGSWIKMY
jgi:hypothetical protein